MKQQNTIKTSDIAEYIELSPARTRALLTEIKEIEANGSNANRTYILKNEDIKKRIILVKVTKMIAKKKTG